MTKYFAMEDFLCISWVAQEGPTGVLQSYYTDNEFGVYRPTSIHVYYFLCRLLFDLDARGYHLVNLVSHVVNVLLVFALAVLLTRDRWVGFLAGAVYLSRISHHLGVFWAAGINEVWLALAYLLSLLGFVWFSRTRRPLYLIVSLGCFALALTCKENAVTLPLVLLAYGLIFENETSPAKTALHVAPFFVVLGLYIILKFIILKPMVGSLYEVGIGLSTFRNLLIYTLWQLNASHLALVCLKVYSKINPYAFLTDIEVLRRLFGITLIVLIVVLWLSRKRVGWLLSIRQHGVSARLTIFGIAFFLISLIPALLLKNRVQQYYLFVPSIGFSLCVAAILSGCRRKPVAVAVLVFMLLSGAIGYTVADKIPDGRTSTSARYFLEDLNKLLNEDKDARSVYVHNGGTFVYQVLWYGEAFDTFLDRPVPVTFDFQSSSPPPTKTILQVYYDGVHLHRLPTP